MIEIRPATESDIPTVVDMTDALLREDAGLRDPATDLGWARREGAADYARTLADPNAVCLLATDGGDTIAYVSGSLRQPWSIRPGKVAEIYSLYVAPPWRRRGAGERLVAAFIDWAREAAVDRVVVAAYVANTDAIRFYQRVGFAPLEVTLEQAIRPGEKP